MYNGEIKVIIQPKAPIIQQDWKPIWPQHHPISIGALLKPLTVLFDS